LLKNSTPQTKIKMFDVKTI